jgi:3-dehydroquinate synthase
MPTFFIDTPQRKYSAIVERGAVARIREHLPPRHGRVFVVSTEEVWRHQGENVVSGFEGVAWSKIFLPGGEEQKRLAPLEAAAEEMARLGADRSSVVIAFGGGIVNDMGGFLASIFMRGVPVIQVPTTLLAQVDAAIGGKTGVNLVSGKNLVGTFHQPLAALIDPALLHTLPHREYRAGLFEVIKCGVIRSAPLFRLLTERSGDVLARCPDVVDRIIADSVRIKAQVVSADERDGDLRRILNFGHTFGHALEAETRFERFLHGEAVAWGMRAAVHLAENSGYLAAEEAVDILDQIALYGPIPPLAGITADSIFRRLSGDKKTVQGKVHFVVPERIGEVKIVTGVSDYAVREAIEAALA